MTVTTTPQRNARTRLATVPTAVLACVASAHVAPVPGLKATDSGQPHMVTPGIEITGHRAAVWAMQFIPPSGRSVLTGSRDSLIAWHTARPSNGRALSEGSRLLGSAVSPDGSRVAVMTEFGARILDIRSGRVMLEFDEELLRDLLNPVWSPTGDRLSTRTRTHVNIWHPDTGELLRSIDLDGLGRRGRPALAWSPSGERIAVLGVSGRLRIYRAADGDVEFEALEHEGFTRHLRWSRDGRVVATGGEDGFVNLWSTTDWTLYRSLTSPGTTLVNGRSPIDSLEFSADGDRIAASVPAAIRVWSTSSGEELAHWAPAPGVPYTPHYGTVTSIAFSPDGRFLLTGGLDGTAKVWDVDTKGQAAAPDSFRNYVEAVAWSQDGMRYGAASLDGSVRIWDSASHAEISRFEGHGRGTVNSLSHAPSVPRVATAGVDGAVRIWQAGTGLPLFEVERLDGVPRRYAGSALALESVSYSPQSNKVAILFGRGGGELQIRDVTSAVSPPTFVGDGVGSFAWSPDGDRLAVEGPNGLCVVDAQHPSDRPIWLSDLSSSDEWIYHVAWSSDGDRVLSASEKRAAVWDWRTGSVVAAVRPEGGSRYVEESGDGSNLLTVGGSFQAPVVQIWDAATESELTKVEGGRGERLEARFVASGSRFVLRRLQSRPPERSPGIWDAGTGQLLFALEGHSAGVVAMALSSDRHLIATAARDREVRIWRLASGEAVAAMTTRLSRVQGLAFGPNNRSVAAFGIGGAQLWSIGPQRSSGTP